MAHPSPKHMCDIYKHNRFPHAPTKQVQPQDVTPDAIPGQPRNPPSSLRFLRENRNRFSSNRKWITQTVPSPFNSSPVWRLIRLDATPCKIRFFLLFSGDLSGFPSFFYKRERSFGPLTYKCNSFWSYAIIITIQPFRKEAVKAEGRRA